MINKIKIKRLNISEFRNYVSLRLVFDSQQTIFVGDNGAGKTNILEAISLLSPGRGLRRASYSDVTRIGSLSLFSTFACVEGMDGLAEISIKLESKDDRSIRCLRINDVAIRVVDELNSHLRVSWLVPSMDRIFSGPSTERRRFLDRMVFSIDPRHRRRIIDFERLMRGRNRLLSEGCFDPSWCSSIESQMAGLGVEIDIARVKMIDELSSLMAEYIQKENFPHVELNLTGFLDGKLNQSFLELKQEYVKILFDGRRMDSIAKRTLIGPHRSDLVVDYCDKDIKIVHGSTGEQKVVLVGIFLAHARLISNTTGFAPILLLDEISAHLDEGRRNALFRIVSDIGSQIFITGTDGSMFSSLSDTATFMRIANHQAFYL
ncbi:DNA replication/repair protein RecF [Candidatus Liberibacter solanacearum]|uniref:DNA replication and repair protein RecF n=1 Tax=Candidatus Liberibacter solanacearum TaxID=556287 RepID=A0A3R7Q4D5_9HYPH|nr:DNA replication/repair protein RecF [Candidatus Liberibacter solanacearum]RPD37764.1 DNA replication/repair protein RecF [Candidatus Liberibacter solanacearum]